ncbi:MAG: hypothetical protein JNK05_36265 [Myxococcales bacterium]|nr:hypothetical protein [Myxococcales bacterium]
MLPHGVASALVLPIAVRVTGSEPDQDDDDPNDNDGRDDNYRSKPQ